MYSVQDERLDLKRKSSSVYIVESDNDFFFVVLFKHINNSVRPFRFFFHVVAIAETIKEKVKMDAHVSNPIKCKLGLK